MTEQPDDWRATAAKQIATDIAQFLIDQDWLDETDAQELETTTEAHDLGLQILTNIETHYGM